MNTFKTIAACAVFCWASAPAFAQKPPSYAEARQLYNQFGKTIAAVGLWDKKQQAERTQLLQAAIALNNKAEKLFPPFSQCLSAANMHVSFVSSLNAIGRSKDGINSPTHFELMMALASAEQFGNHRAACYDQVEALDEPKKK